MPTLVVSVRVLGRPGSLEDYTLNITIWLTAGRCLGWIQKTTMACGEKDSEKIVGTTD